MEQLGSTEALIFARLFAKLKAAGPIRMELFEAANAMADLPDDEFLVEIMKRYSPVTEEEAAALGLTALLMEISSFTRVANSLPQGMSRKEVMKLCREGGFDTDVGGYICMAYERKEEERRMEADVAQEVGARKALLEDAALLTHLPEKDRVLALLKKHDYIYAEEAYMLGLPGFEQSITQLLDEGHPIECLLFGRYRMYCLKEAQQKAEA
jgi:hypothetical protein